MLIQTIGLSKVYGTGETAVHALDGVNLAVEQGEFFAIYQPAAFSVGLDQCDLENPVVLDSRILVNVPDKETPSVGDKFPVAPAFDNVFLAADDGAIWILHSHFPGIVGISF